MLCVATLATTVVGAQTVTWSIQPIYDNLEEYAPNAYKCTIGDKHGVVLANGEVVVPVEADEITPAYEGKALTLVNRGDLQLITGFLDIETMKYYKLEETYYTNDQYSHFSEGLISVRNYKGLMGYLDVQGNVKVDFKYDTAYPFSEGLALVHPVGGKKSEIYISKHGQILQMGFDNGKIQYGTTFKDGKAIVCHGSRLYTIRKGQRPEYFAGEIKYDPFDHSLMGETSKADDYYKFEPEPFCADVEIFQLGEFKGYRFGDGTTIPAQFEHIENFRGLYAKAWQNSKCGLFKLVNISFDIAYSTDDLIINADGQPTEYELTLDIVGGYSTNKLRVEFDSGNGVLEPIEMSGDSEHLVYRAVPNMADGAEKLATRCKVWYDGFLVRDERHTINVKYQVNISISEIMAVGTKASKDNIQCVTATVTNKTAKTLIVDVKFTAQSQTKDENGQIRVSRGSQSYPVTLRSGESRAIEHKCHVYKDFYSEVEVEVLDDAGNHMIGDENVVLLTRNDADDSFVISNIYAVGDAANDADKQTVMATVTNNTIEAATVTIQIAATSQQRNESGDISDATITNTISEITLEGGQSINIPLECTVLNGYTTPVDVRVEVDGVKRAEKTRYVVLTPFYE